MRKNATGEGIWKREKLLNYNLEMSTFLSTSGRGIRR
jgi:hypothetical protein